MKTKLLPNGMTAFCRLNGSTGHRDVEEATEFLKEVLAQGFNAKLFAPENAPFDVVVILV